MVTGRTDTAEPSPDGAHRPAGHGRRRGPGRGGGVHRRRPAGGLAPARQRSAAGPVRSGAAGPARRVRGARAAGPAPAPGRRGAHGAPLGRAPAVIQGPRSRPSTDRPATACHGLPWTAGHGMPGGRRRRRPPPRGRSRPDRGTGRAPIGSRRAVGFRAFPTLTLGERSAPRASSPWGRARRRRGTAPRCHRFTPRSSPAGAKRRGDLEFRDRPRRGPRCYGICRIHIQAADSDARTRNPRALCGSESPDQALAREAFGQSARRDRAGRRPSPHAGHLTRPSLPPSPPRRPPRRDCRHAVVERGVPTGVLSGSNEAVTATAREPRPGARRTAGAGGDGGAPRGGHRPMDQEPKLKHKLHTSSLHTGCDGLD